MIPWGYGWSFYLLYRWIGGEVVNLIGDFSLQVVDLGCQIVPDFANRLRLCVDGCLHLIDFLGDG